MGAAIAAELRRAGHEVVWASEDRSEATRARAAGLTDAGTADELARRSEVVLSVCPPHAALEVAGSIGSFNGVYVDANAVSPETARRVAEAVEAAGAVFVDGGIVGPPPREPGSTRLYLSGPSAALVSGLFEGTAVDARVVSDRVGAASAVKMAYAAWTKGTAALVLATRALAQAEEVEPVLLDEWNLSLPDVTADSERAARAADAKGWRWVGEMEEIAATFAAAGLPAGFHEAAAEVFRRWPDLS
jgi:3-hydroxyisobutyrate dehydrogenase-like beta-hydroxyacid dehydrogenase